MKEDKVIAPDYWEKRYWKHRKYVLGLNESLVNAETLNVEYREKLDELSKAFDKAEQMVDELLKEKDELKKENTELKNKIKEYEKKFGYKIISEAHKAKAFELAEKKAEDSKSSGFTEANITGADLFK